MNDDLLNPRPITPDAVASLCERAADEVLIRGHAQGIAMDDKGRVCLIGALGCAAGMFVEPYCSWITLLGNPLVGHAHSAGLRLGYGYTWNDQEATTGDDLRDAFLHTAKAIRNGEIEVCP